VVGGGISGIIAANYLARAGVQVNVFEQNHHTGGNMSGFSRKGYYFDGGDQSFESLGIVFPILKDLGIYDKIRWTQMRYRFMSKDFDFFLDSFASVEDALCVAFPLETGIRTLFKEIKEVASFIDKHCSAHHFPLINDFSLWKSLSYLPMLPKLLKWLTYDYRVKACSVIRDPTLRNWFSCIGYYHMPYLFFAGFWNIWMKDYWYPVGGMQHLHDVLAANLKSLGGIIHCNTRVESMQTEGSIVKSITTSKQEVHTADQIIYAADYKSLVSQLLPSTLYSPTEQQKIQTSKLTESLFAVYLGLNQRPEELGKQLQANHTFWFPNYEAIFPNQNSLNDIHSRMWVTANYFGDDNPNFAPAGKATLVLQTYSSHNWQQYWGNNKMEAPRSAEYLQQKEKVARELITTAENFLPGLSGKIDYMEAGTPLSHYRFSLNSEGSSGGWCYDDKQSLSYKSSLFRRMITPLSNLTACGHYALWPGGVISAALSGRFAANKVLGKGMLHPIER